MPASPTMVDAINVLGVAAPECDECEGAGTVTFFHGPYERNARMRRLLRGWASHAMPRLHRRDEPEDRRDLLDL